MAPYRGVSLMLLEAHKDFDREFRGNISNPSVMEIMEKLGLVDCLLGLHHPKEWMRHALFSVESDRLRRWYHPGLLLIGDAAHVVSPVGEIGINLVMQEAVLAADILGDPLESRRLGLRDVAAMQRRRELPARFIQGAQALPDGGSSPVRSTQARHSDYRPFSIFLLRAPFLRGLLARLIAFGAWPVHVRTEPGGKTRVEENSLQPNSCDIYSL